MKNQEFDVIVAGAGPAGSVCAWTLASGGANVLLLEKCVFPREKYCAGGVPAAVFDIIPVSFMKKKSIPIRGYFFTFRGRNEASGCISEGQIYSIDRKVFDMDLAKMTQEAGAKLIEGTGLTGVWQENGIVYATTACGKTYYARYLVGADGGSSIVARSLGLNNTKRQNTGICGYFEFHPDAATRNKYHRAVHLDFNFIDNGFAGILPKEDHLWVGIYRTCPCQLQYLEQETYRFIKEMDLRGEVKKFKGKLISLYKKNKKLTHGNILLAGEAACLVNPLSGEGIKSAMESGKIAAEEILKALSDGKDMENYSLRIFDEIGSEMMEAAHFSRLAFMFPSIAYEGMIRVADDALKIMNGSLSYRSFLERLGKKILKKIVISDSEKNPFFQERSLQRK